MWITDEGQRLACPTRSDTARLWVHLPAVEPASAHPLAICDHNDHRRVDQAWTSPRRVHLGHMLATQVVSFHRPYIQSLCTYAQDKDTCAKPSICWSAYRNFSLHWQTERMHILLDFSSIPVIYSQLPLGPPQASCMSNVGDASLTMGSSGRRT
jgi:hypothetical protein